MNLKEFEAKSSPRPPSFPLRRHLNLQPEAPTAESLPRPCKHRHHEPRSTRIYVRAGALTRSSAVDSLPHARPLFLPQRHGRHQSAGQAVGWRQRLSDSITTATSAKRCCWFELHYPVMGRSLEEQPPDPINTEMRFRLLLLVTTPGFVIDSFYRLMHRRHSCWSLINHLFLLFCVLVSAKPSRCAQRCPLQMLKLEQLVWS